MSRKRTGILISGRGSNMEALIKAASSQHYPAEIVAVVSNQPDAAGLVTARQRGIDATCVDHRDYSGREAFEAQIEQCLLERGVELVACAGFMRVLSEGFVHRWTGRLINIHPSLLPAYPGLNTHERVLSDGVEAHGCTVHFVDHDVDCGPIIAQSALQVSSADSSASLAERVLALEHLLYPMALGWVASGDVRLEQGRVTYAFDVAGNGPPLIDPTSPSEIKKWKP